MPVPCFLGDLATLGQNVALTLNLVAHRILDRAQAVYVLGLGASSKLLLTLWSKRNVCIAANIAALHLGVRNIHALYDVANSVNISRCKLRRLVTRTKDWLGDNLNQWDTGSVVVNQGVFRTLDSAG